MGVDPGENAGPGPMRLCQTLEKLPQTIGADADPAQRLDGGPVGRAFVVAGIPV